MKSFDEYIRIPENFNVDYVKTVYGSVNPILLIAGILITAISIFIIGIGIIEIVRGKDTGRFKLSIGLVLILLAAAITKWYVIIFYPDQFLQILF